MRKIFLVVSGVISLSASANAQDVGAIMDARMLSQVIATADICGYKLDAEKTSAIVEDIMVNGPDEAKAMFQMSGGAQKIRIKEMSDTEREITCASQKRIADAHGILIKEDEKPTPVKNNDSDQEALFISRTCIEFTDALDTFASQPDGSPTLDDTIPFIFGAGFLAGLYQAQLLEINDFNDPKFTHFMADVYHACIEKPDASFAELALDISYTID